MSRVTGLPGLKNGKIAKFGHTEKDSYKKVVLLIVLSFCRSETGPKNRIKYLPSLFFKMATLSRRSISLAIS
jgi:hypothetical protein